MGEFTLEDLLHQVENGKMCKGQMHDVYGAHCLLGHIAVVYASRDPNVLEFLMEEVSQLPLAQKLAEKLREKYEFYLRRTGGYYASSCSAIYDINDQLLWQGTSDVYVRGFPEIVPEGDTFKERTVNMLRELVKA